MGNTRIHRDGLATALVVLCAILGPADEIQAADTPHDDEQVILFPTAANLSDDGSQWIVPIHGWIFEPEEDDALRLTALEGLQKASGLDSEGPLTELFAQRAGGFLVDNERGKSLAVRIAAETFDMDASDADGHFTGDVRISVELAASIEKEGVIEVDIVTRNDDPRRFTGSIRLVAPIGLTIISDIDDTIKITNVLDRAQMIRNTFVRPFEPVAGMPELYQQIAAAAPGAGAGAGRVDFQFVSSSPWQLYRPLEQFAQESLFPPATFHLKRVRPKDRSVLDLFADPETTKPPVIESIIVRWPQRRFVLIGDSGEKDPEVYGRIGREHPLQIKRILIRDVTGEPRESPRYTEAFHGLPASMWTTFTDPAEVQIESIPIPGPNHR